MTYQEAEAFLFSELQNFQEKGRIAFNGTLKNALKLSELSNDAHKNFKSIHVGGTNGKGSVSHIIAAGLQANGYKVGLFTSPHYKTFRERIKINGIYISEHEVASFIENLKPDIIQIRPSFFEITSAMAFHHFAKNEVDFAIIEVGLGGRLDSTNIISPIVSVITNISYDHQNILGDTLEKIAYEKAGIIKSKTPVIIGESQTDIKLIFNHWAKEVEAPIYYADELCELSFKEDSRSSILFTTRSNDFQISLQTQLTNPYQLKNLKTALFTLYKLKDNFQIDTKKVASGIENIQPLTNYIGRWSIVKENPTVIFDSAHNVAGVNYLVEEVKNMSFDTLRIVWGTTKEKDVDQILSILPETATYYFCQADNSRALDAEELRKRANSNGLSGYDYASVKVAYRLALAEANPNDLIIVSGSTFVIAEVI